MDTLEQYCETTQQNGLLWVFSDEFEDYLAIYNLFWQALCQYVTGTVCEVGSGDCLIARKILSYDRCRTRRISRYIALDTDERMIEWVKNVAYSAVPVDPRLDILHLDFHHWQPPFLFHTLISKFVAHHHPDALVHWYSKMYNMLEPGGTFIHLDEAAPLLPDTSHQATEDVIRSGLHNLGHRPLPTADYLAHLREDAELLVPLATHIDILESTGFHVEVLGSYRLHYSLIAKKR